MAGGGVPAAALLPGADGAKPADRVEAAAAGADKGAKKAGAADAAPAAADGGPRPKAAPQGKAAAKAGAAPAPAQGKAAAKGKAAKKGAASASAGDEAADDDEEGILDLAIDEIQELEEEAAEALQQTGGSLQRLRRFLPVGRRAGSKDLSKKQKQLESSPEHAHRFWDLQCAIRSLKYVGKGNSIDTFLAVSICPADGVKLVRQAVRLLPEYSPAVILTKNEDKVLDNPHVLWRSKIFKLPYRDLDKHVLSIAMWKISKMTFNTYCGHGVRSLAKIVRQEANIQFAIKEKFTKEAEEQRRKKRKLSVPDVAMLGLTVNAEEIFDFQLHFENWSLEFRKQQKKEKKDEKKCLIFQVPKNRRSDASSNKNCYTQRVPWKSDQDKLVWTTLGTKEPFYFRGTRTALQNSFVIVKVHSVRSLLHPDQPPRAPMSRMVGAALMNMTSILDISVFTGRVKDLQTVRESFNVGTVNGSIKAVMCSMKMKHPEDIKGGRPQQPKTATTVGHLNPAEQHLVVRVMKCDGLAVADPELGTSDPYVRCTWDNMVQKSPVLKETVRPVFNFNFFFPVRLFNSKLKKRRYFDTALKFELESKGDISIQVWDDDDTSADSLGFVKLPLWKILSSRRTADRTLRGPAPKAKDDEEAPEGAAAQKQWFDKERELRYYDGMRTELTGCTLQSASTPLIFFEAYFYPDWPEDVQLDPEEGDHGDEDLWKNKEKAFNELGAKFAKSYAEPFPDSIGAHACVSDAFSKKSNLRRFTSIGQHPQTMQSLPLMAFLCKIITPEEYTRPAALMHWINCITFSMSSRQERSGEIPKDGWKDPQTFLFSRKGPVQDHALLLCSVLLGAKKDAFVCKGTIWVADEENSAKPSRLVEHTWVLTREADDWITFWECTTREVFHLKKRWTRDKSKKKKKLLEEHNTDENEDADEDADEEDIAEGAGVGQEALANEIPDEKLQMEDLEALPTVGRMPRPKMRAQAKKDNPRDKMIKDILRQREKNFVAPRMQNPNLTDEEFLVDWLPYDSIDVCFNDRNLYANRQNHHPAMVLYNFEEEPLKEGAPRSWEPLIEGDADEEQENGKYRYKPINQEVVIDPAMTFDALERREIEMISEMEENMRLSRGKRGMDTYFEKGEILVARLNKFLWVMEQMRKLDIDLCPFLLKDYCDMTDGEKYLMKLRCGHDTEAEITAQQFNTHGSAFVSAKSRYKDTYVKETETDWNKLAEQAEQFANANFLDGGVLRGKKFSGFPCHFCTSDKEEVRGYLMGLPEYQKLVENKSEGTVFTIHCKMFALLGGVQSLWLYVGMHEPLN